MTSFNASKLIAAFTMVAAIAVPTMLPATAQAQDRNDRDRGRSDRGRASHDRREDRRNDDRRRDDRRHDDHRQDTKNQWRNLGIAGGAVGVLGLLTGNKTLAALGIGGGLYSASRYEADRKSQNQDDHRRYELFNRSSFDHDGHHYIRRTKTVRGEKQFYFERSR